MHSFPGHVPTHGSRYISLSTVDPPTTIDDVLAILGASVAADVTITANGAVSSLPAYAYIARHRFDPGKALAVETPVAFALLAVGAAMANR